MKQSNLFLNGAILIAAVLVCGLVWDSSRSKLLEESRKVQKLTDQLERLKTENQQLLRRISQAEKADKLAQERFKELTKLRNEVRETRKQQAAEIPRATQAQTPPPPAKPAPEPTRRRQEGLPRDSWAFVGFKTPENALQSIVWAMSHGEVKTFMDSLTESAQERAAKEFDGKTEEEIAQYLVNQVQEVQAIRFNRKELPSGEVSFGLRVSEKDNGAVRTADEAILKFQNVEGEWKLSYD